MTSLYRIYYSGSAFGDNLFSAYVTNVLRSNDFDAFLDNPRIIDLVDCPRYFKSINEEGNVYSFDCVRRNRTGKQTMKKYNVFSDLIAVFKEQFNIRYPIHLNLDHIPVKFSKLPGIPEVDVVMVTKTGYWTPYRNWPFFENLKDLFDKNSITYIDVSEENIMNNLLLNYVANAKLFLGLETGASHYVSKFANGKTLILQSGYTDFEYWAGKYNYDCIRHKVICSPCWKREGCIHHNCMKNLQAHAVYDEIAKRIIK